MMHRTTVYSYKKNQKISEENIQHLTFNIQYSNENMEVHKHPPRNTYKEMANSLRPQNDTGLFKN